MNKKWFIIVIIAICVIVLFSSFKSSSNSSNLTPENEENDSNIDYSNSSNTNTGSRRSSNAPGAHPVSSEDEKRKETTIEDFDQDRRSATNQTDQNESSDQDNLTTIRTNIRTEIVNRYIR